MKYGKEAGKLRNDDIVKESDMIVAFWDMESPGTKDTITKAENLCKPIRIIQFDNKKDDKLCFEENNDELYIYGKDTYHLKDEIKKIGGKWNNDDKKWVIEKCENSEIIKSNLNQLNKKRKFLNKEKYVKKYKNS